MVELFTIDEDSGGPLFGTVGDQVFGAEGRIYVSDYQSMQVYEYTSRGEYVRSIGGPGDAPGEFQIPVTLRTLDDLLYVYDNQSYRISVFDQSTGAFQTSRNVKVDDMRPYQFMGLTQDSIVMTFSQPNPGLMVEGMTDIDIRLIPLAGADSAQVIWKTPGTDWKPIEFNGMRMLRNMPLSFNSYCTFEKDKGYCAYSNAVTVNIFSADGDSLQTVSVGAEPRAVTAVEREEILSRFQNEELRNQMIIPETHPAFSGSFVVDESGRIWIRRGVIEGNTEYWILDPGNSTTFQLNLPGSVIINAVKDGKAIARITLDDGQQAVRVYSVPDPASD